MKWLRILTGCRLAIQAAAIRLGLQLQISRSKELVCGGLFPAMYLLPGSLLLLIFSFSPRLSCLQLSKCNNTEVTLIRKTELLTSLTLSNCTLPHVENGFFVRFDHLLHLELQHSGLSDLDDFSLNGLTKLQYLSCPTTIWAVWDPGPVSLWVH